MLPRNNNTNDSKKITSTNLIAIDLDNTLYFYHKAFACSPGNLLESTPREECWRFLIDGKEQDKLGLASLETYEQRESGYFASMGIAFSYMLDVVKSSSKINLLDFCSVLHIKSLSAVRTGTRYHRTAPSEIDETQKIITSAGQYQGNTYEQAYTLITIFENKVNKIEISSFKKLKLIVDLIYDLVKLSPFKDANNRVFVKLLLNFLLLNHGFPPIILQDHLIFESTQIKSEQLLEEVIRGMNRSLHLAREEPSDSYHLLSLKTLSEKTLLDYNKTTDLLKVHFPYAMHDNSDQLQSLQLFLKDEPKSYQEALIFVEKIKLELNHRSAKPYDVKQEQHHKFKDIVLNMEKQLLSGFGKKWELSLFGGKLHQQDEKTTVKIPHKIAHQLQIIKEAKLRESKDQNPNWQVVLDLLVYCGKQAKKWSLSSDEIRQDYYGLFSKYKNNAFIAHFGGSDVEINPIWHRHFK